MTVEKFSGKRIYLDHNATTPLDGRVLEEMLPYLRDDFGNPSSIYAEGRVVRNAMEKARSQVACLLGARDDEIYFTSGGTESDNLALRGAARAVGETPRRIVTSAVEHEAILQPVERLAREGFEIDILPVDSYARVDPDSLRQSLAAGGSTLVSIIAANNEVGTIEPFEELGEAARQGEAIFHIDAVQVVGKVSLDLESLPVDLLSLSGHKIYGPKGVGALYVRKGVRLDPLILGGSQERKLRAGTENVAGIVGLGAACELAAGGIEERNQRLTSLRDRLWKGLSERIEGTHLNGHPTERLSNTLNVSFDSVEGEALVMRLDLEGISISTKSACASGSLEPSHVLGAMGVHPSLLHNSVRFSLGRGNTGEEIDRAAEATAQAVARLREL